MVNTSKNRTKISYSGPGMPNKDWMHRIIQKYKHRIPVSQMAVAREASASAETIRRMYAGVQFFIPGLEVLKAYWLQDQDWKGKLPEDMDNFFKAHKL